MWGSDIDVNTLTVDDARNYVQWNLYEKTPYANSSRQDLANEKGISVRTTNGYIIMAKALFNVLEEEGIATNIFKDIKQVADLSSVIGSEQGGASNCCNFKRNGK